MKWFKHDTDASTDAKIRKLLIRYGAVGYAIYFHSLELIAGNISESNLTFELEHDSEVIADNLHIKGDANRSGREIVEEVMRYIVELGLFEESGNRIFCFKLLHRLDASVTGSPRFRKLIAEAKRENHDKVMTVSCQSHDNVMTESWQCHDKEIEIEIEKNIESAHSARHSLKKFQKPTIEEVAAYCSERKNGIDPESFWNFYEAKGWLVGKSPMKDWKAAVRTWEKRHAGKPVSIDKPIQRRRVLREGLVCPVCGSALIAGKEYCLRCHASRDKGLPDEYFVEVP